LVGAAGKKTTKRGLVPVFVVRSKRKEKGGEKTGFWGGVFWGKSVFGW